MKFYFVTASANGEKSWKISAVEVVSVTVVDAEVDLATAEGFETTVTRRAVTATAAEAAGQTATDFSAIFGSESEY